MSHVRDDGACAYARVAVWCGMTLILSAGISDLSLSLSLTRHAKRESARARARQHTLLQI